MFMLEKSASCQDGKLRAKHNDVMKHEITIPGSVPKVGIIIKINGSRQNIIRKFRCSDGSWKIIIKREKISESCFNWKVACLLS